MAFTFASQIRIERDTHIFPQQVQHLLEAFIHRELTGFQYKIWMVRGLIIWVNSSETWTMDVKKKKTLQWEKD